MDNEMIFEICNAIALFNWVVLILVPYSRLTIMFTIGIVVTLLSIVYIAMVAQSFDPNAFTNFNTLEGVMGLFKNPIVALAGWIHYLAFDLMVGVFIVTDANKQKINKWLLLPSLLLTFMLGPTGLILYLMTRWVKTKKYFVDIR